MIAAIVAAATLSDDFDAQWTLGKLPELALDEIDDTPPTSKGSQDISRTPQGHATRSETPMSRIGSQTRRGSQTPLSNHHNARKRHMDSETASSIVTKRQRMTPVEEVQHDGDRVRILNLEGTIEALRSELDAERHARQIAEAATVAAEQKKIEWHTSLSQLQHRYEKRTKKSHLLQKHNKALTTAVENGKARLEKVNADNATMRAKVSEQKNEIMAAREALKLVGGDIAALEHARESERAATDKVLSLEKSAESNRRDFEFLRSQYQDASQKAAQYASQVTGLEKQNATLLKQSDEQKIKLKELNYRESIKAHLAKINQLETEKKSREALIKKQEAEIQLLKRSRGVQTRGSSVQPGSPAPRSRQVSPAPGHLAASVGNRASVLRHER